jgi:hypothetical protein
MRYLNHFPFCGWPAAPYRWLYILVVPAAIATGQEAVAQASYPDTALARFEAELLAEPFDSLPFLNQEAVGRMALALADIRSQHASVKNIVARRERRAITLLLTDTATGALRSRMPSPPLDSFAISRTVRQIGIGAIDSLNAKLGATSTQIVLIGTTLAYLSPQLPRSLNIRVIARMYEELSDVKYVTDELIPITQDHQIHHFRKAGEWFFVFEHFWCMDYGYCPKNSYFYVIYNPVDRRSTLVDTVAPGMLSPSSVRLWNVPGLRSFAPFGGYGDLLVALADSRWWIRLHALQAVGVVLSQLAGRPDQGWSGSSRAQIYDTVRSSLRSTLLTIARRVDDDDPDVAAGAEQVLRGFTGQEFGAGSDSRIRWIEFIESTYHDEPKSSAHGTSGA